MYKLIYLPYQKITQRTSIFFFFWSYSRQGVYSDAPKFFGNPPPLLHLLSKRSQLRQAVNSNANVRAKFNSSIPEARALSRGGQGSRFLFIWVWTEGPNWKMRHHIRTIVTQKYKQNGCIQPSPFSTKFTSKKNPCSCMLNCHCSLHMYIHMLSYSLRSTYIHTPTVTRRSISRVVWNS